MARPRTRTTRRPDRGRAVGRRSTGVAALGLFLLAAASGAAEPVKVTLKEGETRGFLVLRPPGAEPIAQGELGQRVRASVESRLLLNFKDGSLFDEVVTFSQNGVFRLESYRLT